MKYLIGILVGICLALATMTYSHAATPTASDKIVDFAIGKVNAVIDGAAKAMPKVTEYAMKVTSLDCLVHICIGLACLFAAIGLTYILYKTIMLAIRLEEENNEYFIPLFLISGLGGLFTAGVYVNSFMYLTNFWKWIGIFYPDLYLIHLAVQKVTG